MEQDHNCPIQYGSICVQYCEENGQTIEDKKEAFHLLTPCECKLALSIIIWMSTLYLLGMGLRRMTRERYGFSAEYLLILLAIAHNLIFFIALFVVAAEQHGRSEGIDVWRCLLALEAGAAAFFLWNLYGLYMILLPRPINPGNFHNFLLRHRRQG